MSGKRSLEELVQRCTWRMDKARKIAVEATAMADQLEGDLFMAKRALETLNTEGNGNASTATNENPDPADEEEAMERERREFESEQEVDNCVAQHEAQNEAEAEASPDGTLSGYPDDGTTPENGTFEALLKAGTLQLKLVDRPGYAPDQAIEPGPKGRKNDVFEYKELFKKCYPRFFFNGEAKEWRRTAPAGWTGQPPAAA